VVQILCRRNSNNPILAGEPGVGKTAIVEGLAQLIADGDAPVDLSEKHILAFNVSLIIASTKDRGQCEQRFLSITEELMESTNSIMFIDDLEAVAGGGPMRGSFDALEILRPALSQGMIQCLFTTTPSGYRRSVEKHPWIAHCSRVVNVPPLGEEESILAVYSVKHKYEGFHNVVYDNAAVRCAVRLSKLYIPDRYLPAKAVDVIDEAGARVRLIFDKLPGEIKDTERRLKFIVHRMESAIGNHEFEKARFYSNEEHKERENLRRLQEKYEIGTATSPTVTREDIKVVVADWTGVPVNIMREDYPGGDSVVPHHPVD